MTSRRLRPTDTDPPSHASTGDAASGNASALVVAGVAFSGRPVVSLKFNGYLPSPGSCRPGGSGHRRVSHDVLASCSYALDNPSRKRPPFGPACKAGD